MVHDLQLLVRDRVCFVEVSILITRTDLQPGKATVVVGYHAAPSDATILAGDKAHYPCYH